MMGTTTRLRPCPGSCGRLIIGNKFACPRCWEKLPGDLRVAIAESFLVHEAHIAARAEGRLWFLSRAGTA